MSPEKKSTLSKNEIIYGVFDDWSSCLTLNHSILIQKYFLYTNTLDDKRPQFADFITLVQDKIDIEKYIARMKKNSSAFTKKWSNFLTWENFLIC